MKYFILSIVILTLTACTSGPFVPPVECEGQPSLILEKFPDPRGLDKALLSVQLAAMTQIKGYEKKDAIQVLNDIEDRITNIEKATYADLVGLVTSKLKIANSLAGGVVFIIGQDLDVLSEPVPISACDMALVRKHLAKQKALIAIAGE